MACKFDSGYPRSHSKKKKAHTSIFKIQSALEITKKKKKDCLEEGQSVLVLKVACILQMFGSPWTLMVSKIV